MNDHRRRIEELAKDPAHDGKISPKSMREAEVGVALEQYIILDTQNLVPDHVERLREAIESNGWSDKILWYP